VFLGFSAPSASQAGELLFSAMGLFVLTPVLALGLASALVLARRGPRRAEALVVLAIVALYLLYNASLRSVSPFGGLGPPRYLITVIPFVMIPLALALRRFPLATSALAFVSAAQMTMATATGALAMYDWRWLDRVRARQFVETAAAVLEVTGWYAIAPFVAAVAAAAAAAAASLPRPAVARADALLAAGLLAAWAILALAADNPAGATPSAGYVAALAGCAALLVAAVALAARRASQNVSAKPTEKSTADDSTHVTA
jgi:hypothetical protein